MPTVIIYWSPGRNPQQKKTVIEQITDVLVNEASAKQEDVLVIFQEILPGDFGRGGQVILPFESTSSSEENKNFEDDNHG
ncbi:MAG: tautomerase family protein [Chloroflexi bacterium]|nr:tautomerase family protein [Chloroflexota bacterium]